MKYLTQLWLVADKFKRTSGNCDTNLMSLEYLESETIFDKDIKDK